MYQNSLPMAGMQQVKELLNVKVFQLNEYDAVAAFSLEEAKEWYMKHTGLNADEAFYDYESHEISGEEKIYEDERMEEMVSVNEIVESYWQGSPFIAVTSNC
ncbi:hypothetical protein [Priestia megaterium]|uniref:hypothetical protein n=1 Tax=Priestia megaterium TaxID=1404 RepID=UPI002D80B722|nr:hypothetical protein [Priestia megaterium]MEB4856112.1 hypothetical protein [Priestia megaterium]